MKRLFGADGIRGTIGRHPVIPEGATRLGRAIAAWLLEYTSQPSFLIGTDTRESCQRIKVALIDGLIQAGVRVVDIGVVPTAAVSYLIARKGFFSGGAIVTASHNPIIENGIKVFNQRGRKITDEAEQLIEERFFGKTALPFRTRPAQSTSEPDYEGQYAQALAGEYRDYEWGRCRIILDCANGAAYRIAPQVLDELGISYSLFNASPNGININQRSGSEYTRSHPYQLTDSLLQCHAGVGIALDGDADRALLVDRQGYLYDGDMFLAMLGLKLHREQTLRQDAIVTTQMSNSGLRHYLRRYQIETYLVRNGDKYVTDALLTRDLTLGGEQIGHTIIRTDDTHVTGDGLRTALAILAELTRRSESSLRDLAPGMRKWPQVKASVYMRHRVLAQADEIAELPDLLQETQEAIPDLTREVECRPASTEPVYRIMLEARFTDVATLARHARRLGEHVQHHFACLGLPIEVWDCVDGGKIDGKTDR